MEIPLSELIDRMTILKLKTERLPEEQTISEQFGIITSESIATINKFDDATKDKIVGHIKKIYFYNGKKWDLEFDIRKGSLGKEDLAEIGRRALLIREYNGKRLHHKNAIANLTSNLIMYDVKIDHQSEE